ncbi:hypothetical protein HMPREF0239_00332 [Clostridium sp. ATCC BAA-442]|nr:hypothetical protein HMPREF0239_00332 [Clostridium sp. ATCC BAA-442]
MGETNFFFPEKKLAQTNRHFGVLDKRAVCLGLEGQKTFAIRTRITIAKMRNTSRVLCYIYIIIFFLASKRHQQRASQCKHQEYAQWSVLYHDDLVCCLFRK